MNEPGRLPAAARRRWRRREGANPIVELTLSRFREFLREPEAVFWVFAFPLIMTCALGIAFRSRGSEPIIARVRAPARADRIARALEQKGAFPVRPIPAADADRALRDRKAPVIVVPG